MEFSKKTIVYRAKTFQEMQTVLKNIANVQPIAGATGFLQNQTDRLVDLPVHVLDLCSIPELRMINKNDSFFEFGAAVTLQEILDLGEKKVPEALYRGIETIANMSVRTLATIGGNIARLNPLNGAFLPILALDSKLEIRTADSAEWIPFTRYTDDSFAEKRAVKHVITRIRIPNETWTRCFYTRLGTQGYIDRLSASFLFLLKIQKNLLSEMRLFFAADKPVREKEFDNLLLGKALPLAEKDIAVILEKAELIFPADTLGSAFHRACFFNLLEDTLYRLT